MKISFLLSIGLNIMLILAFLRNSKGNFNSSPKNTDQKIVRKLVEDKVSKATYMGSIGNCNGLEKPSAAVKSELSPKVVFTLHDEIQDFIRRSILLKQNPTEVAIDWGKKLPVPKNESEYFFNYLLMSRYDRIRLGRYGGLDDNLGYLFENMNNSFTDYMGSCLEKLDSKTEIPLRSFVYSIATESRKDFPFFKELNDDVDYQDRYIPPTDSTYDHMIFYMGDRAKRYLASDQSETFRDFDTRTIVQSVNSGRSISSEEADKKNPQ